MITCTGDIASATYLFNQFLTNISSTLSSALLSRTIVEHHASFSVPLSKTFSIFFFHSFLSESFSIFFLHFVLRDVNRTAVTFYRYKIYNCALTRTPAFQYTFLIGFTYNSCCINLPIFFFHFYCQLFRVLSY